MLDPLDDITNLVESMTASEYLSDVLVSEHGFHRKDANARAKMIIPHLKMSLSYLEQSKSGPSDVSFLPLYYALLNLSKCYILVGPHFNQLPSNRWHGAHYPVTAKDSQNLLTEFIVIHKGGAIPLLYKTITGKTISKNHNIYLSDIYPFIPDISVEYSLATKKPASLAVIEFSTEHNNLGQVVPCIKFIPRNATSVIPGKNIKIFLGLKQHPAKPDTYVDSAVNQGQDPFLNIKNKMRSYLLYPSDVAYSTPISNSNFLLPEEIPILLAFFHLSNVVRYKPEFFNKIRNSKHWPMISAAKRHSVLKFLTLFWSYVHNTTLFIEHR